MSNNHLSAGQLEADGAKQVDATHSTFTGEQEDHRSSSQVTIAALSSPIQSNTVTGATERLLLHLSVTKRESIAIDPTAKG